MRVPISRQITAALSAAMSIVVCLIFAPEAPAQVTIKTLYSFQGPEGAYPQGGVIIDAAGDLYGCTYASVSSGFTGDAQVFELPVGSTTIKSLAAVADIYGAQSDGGVVSDTHGDLFGTYLPRGIFDGGIFEVRAGSYGGFAMTIAALNGSNGSWASAAPTVDAEGNLYGTTAQGGNLSVNNGFGYGTIYEVPLGKGLQTLATFNLSNGGAPYSELLADTAGNLYGTTSLGGNLSLNSGFGYGTVFEVPAHGGALKTLATFNGSNGASPMAGLIADSAGNLYGTTQSGGANNDGTVFEIPAEGGPVKTLATFNGSNGQDAECKLISDAAGNLYGTTLYGGLGYGGSTESGLGTVFEVPAGGGSVITLAAFNESDGSMPIAGLTADASGNLFGTAYYGGTYSHGTLFEISGSGFVLVPEPSAGLLILLPTIRVMLRRNARERLV